MSSFTITAAVNIDSLTKLGSVAGLAWTRSTTTATVTQNGHGMASNDLFNVTVTSDAAAITVGVKTITVLDANRFTFTCLNAGAASGTVTANHIDDYLINGGYLTIDQHSRYGTNQNLYSVIGDIVMSASLGGTVEINSTKVRTIAYDTGSGNVPALGTTISRGGASGILLGVYSALNAAPTAVGAAMPVTGYVLVRQWNSVAYTAGALTGISASATAADRAGWLEIVGADSLTATVNRLNLFKVRGDYYDFQGVTTDGNRATTYQLPTNGSAVVYAPGVEVETATAGVYEFYPCAGSRTALVANIATDVVRGKWCWISTAGLVRFGNDGTNSTGGYIPPSGRKIRVPNIFFTTCTQAAPTVNVLPNATLTTRYEFSTGGGGAIDIDKASMNWYANFAQPFSVALSNFFTLSGVVLTECASSIAWSNVGVGQEAANTQTALTMGLNFAGGTMTKCTWTRATQGSSGNYTTLWTDCSGFAVTDERNHCLTKSAHASTGVSTFTRVLNSTFTNCLFGGTGRLALIGCADVTWTNTVYYDHPALTTSSGLPMYVWDLSTAASFRLKFDGLSFGDLTLVQPYSGILNIGVAGCVGITLRNLGSAAAPLDMGGAYVDATWTRSSTTTTVTKVGHGLKAGDIIAVNVASDVAAKAVTTTSATLWTVLAAPTADTFTVTVTNAGQTTGQFLSYYPCMAAALVNFVAGSAANTVKIQRCYTPHLRTGLFTTQDNSIKNMLVEQCWGTEWGVQLVPMLNCAIRGLKSTPALTAQTSCYGTHFVDCYTTGYPANISGVAWSRVTTVASVTSTAHGLRVGDQILVTVSSATAAIILGVKTITQIAAAASPQNPANVFNFTCLNAGATSGTLSFIPLNGLVAVQMNEATTETSSLVALENGAAFTSAGTCYMPTIGQRVTLIAEKNLVGHASFPIAEAVMGGGTLANYDVSYSLDSGATYKNLYYPRPGGSGSSGSNRITVTDATGVAVGDYVWGTNIGYTAKVTIVNPDGDNVNELELDIVNIGTVSGILRFNHLPSETIANPLVGTPLRIRIKTTTTNTTAISSLYFFTYSDASARAATYALDVNTLTLTGLVAGSDVIVTTSDTNTVVGEVDANAGTSWGFTFSGAQTVDIKVIKAGYVPWVIYDYALSAADASLPVAQTVDRAYV
jgi:hypothetical protein